MQLSNEDIRITISNNIKFYLNKEGKSRKKVCKDLGLKYTTFCDWVNAKTIPSYGALEQLGKYFGIEAWDFYRASEEQTRRVSIYAQELEKGRLLDMSIVDNLDDEQIKKLLESGFRFKHRTLEEYIRLSGKPMQASDEYDWGEPVGREIW